MPKSGIEQSGLLQRNVYITSHIVEYSLRLIIPSSFRLTLPSGGYGDFSGYKLCSRVTLTFDIIPRRLNIYQESRSKPPRPSNLRILRL